MYQYDHHRGMTTTFAAAISIVALILLHRDDWKCCATRATARLNGDDNHNVVDYGGPKGAVDNHCNLFLAPSSIPNAGYGVFTAKKIRRGDYILRADGPNIAVLVQDVPASNHPNSSLSLFHNVWWGKMGGMSDHMWYETPRRGAVDVYDYQITLGALPNYHPYLSNLNFRQPHVVYDDQTADVPSGGGTTKQKGPNAGAVSYYTGKDFVAHRNIPAGGEIFLDYGERWLDSRGQDFERVPRKADYWRAAELVHATLIKQRRHHPQNQPQRINDIEGLDMAEVLQSMHEMAASVTKATIDQLDHRTSDIALDRIMPLLPRTVEDVERVIQAANDLGGDGTTSTKSGPSIGHIAHALATELSVNKRSTAFLREHGMCLDNILPGPSTIPGAGQGAFAARPLSKGERVVPVPLLHMPDRSVFVRDSADGGGGTIRTEELLINYCFGHSESTLLLCPVTNSLLINHCSPRRAGGCGGGEAIDGADISDTPNAKLQWAVDWDPNTPRSLTKTVEELAQVKLERVLSLEIIALRDIEEGEEIFVDYGEGWDRAWDDHLRKWDDRSSSSSLVETVGPHDRTEVELNLDVKIHQFFPDDLRSVDYETSLMRNQSSRFMTMCWNRFGATTSADRGRDNSTDWRLLSSDEALYEDYALDGWDMVVNHDGGAYGHFFPCSVIAAEDEYDDDDDHDDDEYEYDGDDGGSKDDDERYERLANDGHTDVTGVAEQAISRREEEEDRPVVVIAAEQQATATTAASYIVRIFPSSFHRRQTWDVRGLPRIYTDFPRASIRYFTKPGASDQHSVPNAFRHHIEIPDDMFPPQWKNINNKRLKTQ